MTIQIGTAGVSLRRTATYKRCATYLNWWRKLADLRQNPTPLEFPIASEPHREVWRNPKLLAVHKPHHLLVHRTDLAAQDPENLKDCLVEGGENGYLQPIHRLDRATSGIVMFAREAEAHAAFHQMLMEGQVEKRYFSVVRGWLAEKECEITKPLPTSHNPDPKPARTLVKVLEEVEFPEAMTRYETSRLSLLECRPLTGRFHQIRLHLKHLRHPILGDTAHGDRAHNRWMRACELPYVMLLHAGRIEFDWEGERIALKSHFSKAMESWLGRFGFQSHKDIFE